MRYLKVMEHTDTFDEEGEDARRIAIRLVVMLYRSADLSISPERAREYQAREGIIGTGRPA